MSYNPYSLKGKTILITGASSGIGRTTAIECSKLGATVIITARNIERLNETFLSLDGDVQHQQIISDLTKMEDIENLVIQLPTLDGCVNNAGIVNTLPLQFYTVEEVERIFKVNVISPMMLTKQLVKNKKMKKPSSMVFTSSIGGVYSVGIGNGIYASSKCAIDGYMRTATLELAPKGIRCNSVNPGMTETNIIDSNSSITSEQFENDKKNYPLGRYGKPLDIAHAIIYLLSDASSWVTGTALKIDGGFSLTNK